MSVRVFECVSFCLCVCVRSDLASVEVCASLCSCLDGFSTHNELRHLGKPLYLHEFRGQRLIAQMVKFESMFLNLSDLFRVVV